MVTLVRRTAAAPLFSAPGVEAVALAASDIDALHAFFEENPLYFESVEGRPPAPDAGRAEFDSLPPPELPFGRRWLMAFVEDSGTMAGVADVLADFLAPGIWHIGLFIVATQRHGRGDASVLHGALERWMRAQGARFVRLGVVQGNARAERFWERQGYAEVRKREGVAMGLRVNTLRVMVKPLAEAGLDAYLAQVARDRPEA